MSEANPKTPAPPASQTAATPAVEEQPKARYSKRLKKAQKAEKRITSAEHKLAKAILEGIESWDREREKSSHKKKDGAVKDAVQNYVKASAKVMKKSARVPRAVAKGVLEMYPKNVRKFWGL